jgi:hypothetical protein
MRMSVNDFLCRRQALGGHAGWSVHVQPMKHHRGDRRHDIKHGSNPDQKIIRRSTEEGGNIFLPVQERSTHRLPEHTWPGLAIKTWQSGIFYG